MTDKENILKRLSNLDLTDQELKQLEIDQTLPSDLDTVKKAGAISNELFVPGYSQLLTDKKEEMKSLLDTVSDTTAATSETVATTNDTVDSRQPTTSSYFTLYKLIGLAASVAILIGVFLQPWQKSALSYDDKAAELKQLALTSFESTGVLSGERGDSEVKLEFVNMYENLKSDNCDQGTESSKYKEQEIWMNLYCAWLSNDLKEYEKLEQIIIDNRYPNFKRIPR